ncbi:MAG: hypothetical protein KDD48_05950, partial [Bdellovibrionales bacterium]|nr:hypothetical protein [Bdellovibrionales bacterium]
MNKAPRGQALIVMLIFLFVLIPLFVYLFDLGIVQYSKIRRQKQLDGISLDLATSQARALNAIAALNQGLEIAENRGYLMAASVAGLSACSFFNPKCAQILSRLLPKVRPFYKKLNKLGSHLAKQQDKILEWANKIQ